MRIKEAYMRTKEAYMRVKKAYMRTKEFYMRIKEAYMWCMRCVSSAYLRLLSHIHTHTSGA